jgi:Domain of unknown function (DUF4440)
MRSGSLWALLAWAVLSGVSAAAQQNGGAQTAQSAVLALENRWLQSEKTNNPDSAAPLMAAQYVNTWTDGTVLDKMQTLAGARARHYTSVTDEDVKVRVYHDTAIVTGLYSGKGSDTGKPFDERARWTDTWVKMPDGRWQCVATQYTALKM